MGTKTPSTKSQSVVGKGEAAVATILEPFSQSVPPHFSLYSTHSVFACKRGILSASRADAQALSSAV